MNVQANTVLMNTPFRGIDKLRSVYFIGIGGIGMSAIARFFRAGGVQVSGYDKTPTALTRELEASGIAVHYEENLALAPKEAGLVVYTPAVPATHQELVYYRENGYNVVKRSDVLQLITESSFNVCIAGTHGKTTITSMTAHILRDSGFGCNAFLGGIAVNYGTNFWSSEKNVCVIEADEYDRSFLKLSPDVAVITAMDADHLDIYGTAEAMEEAFIGFSKAVKPGGILISQFGLKRGKELQADQHLTYSLQNEAADLYATNIRMKNGSYEFDVQMPGLLLENVKLNMGGMHNVENAVAAMSVAASLGIDPEKIRAAVESFRGVKRRFELVLKSEKVMFVDDYAHHPTEIEAFLRSMKSMYPRRKLTVIFQPHLFTRTRDFAEGFSKSLSLADEVVLMDIYPARELPIPGVTSDMLVNDITSKVKVRCGKDDLMQKLETMEFDVLATVGAGDIDTFVQPIKAMLKRKYEASEN